MGSSDVAREVDGAGRRRTLGKYQLIAHLGAGGMARVSLAAVRGPGGFVKLVVVKTMREDLLDPVFVRSFLHEARLAAQLAHPNVVHTFEVGEENGRPFLAMEYLEGQSLRAIIRRLAPERIPLSAQLRILTEVARGLHHAHTLVGLDGRPLGIVHRDVSPHNVMITYDGQVKLLDFGIAKARGGDELTRVGTVKGKIDYMAPEQLRGATVDPRADVFALGVMLWEAATGARFSGGGNVADITKIHHRVTGGEPRLREVGGTIPVRVVEICDRALSVDPEDRHATAEELANELSEYLFETSRTTDPRQLAEIVGPLFAKDRESLRQAIDRHVRGLGDGWLDPDEPTSATLPRLPASEGTASRSVEMSSPTRPLPLEHVELGAETKSVESTAPGAHGGPVPRRTAWALLAGAALVGVLIALGRREPLPEARDASIRPVRSTPSVHDRAPSRDYVEVRLDLSPANAIANVDGADVPAGSVARFAIDGRGHRFSVRAPGFAPVTLERGFERDGVLSVSLLPETPPSSRAVATATGATRRGARPAAPRPDLDAPLAVSRSASVATARTDVATETTTLDTRRPGATRIVVEDPYGGEP